MKWTSEVRPTNRTPPFSIACFGQRRSGNQLLRGWQIAPVVRARLSGEEAVIATDSKEACLSIQGRGDRMTEGQSRSKRVTPASRAALRR
jgi:hypothetical protein